MIFVGGIDGVGKSFFCDYARVQLSINYYSASKLILKHKEGLSARVSNISEMEQNQLYLVDEVKQLNIKEKMYLLDGHFCLLSTNNEIIPIYLETFASLGPQAIVLLRDDVSAIYSRLQKRKSIVYPKKLLDDFQNNETTNAIYISEQLNIPMYIVNGTNDYDGIIEQLKQVV